MRKILVVDDILTNRVILKQTLIALGDYDVIEAINGMDAIEKFNLEKPDLILMDIMMPDMDGLEATTSIKESMGEDYTPIIFITALSSEDSLVTALASGGDDFITKPFNVDVLESKINAHLRIRELTQQLNVKNDLLSSFNQRLITEQELIEHFFESAVQQSFLDKNIIKYHMSSMSTFNGDLLLAERAPDGGLYLVMGDFTGHGLTAAMGTLPVAMIFFKMVSERFAVGDIAREINLQLHKLMPSGMFFVASIIEINTRGDIMSVWMGGMPESYWLSNEGEFKSKIYSQHMPLGILADNEFDSSIQVFDIEHGDKVYLYSDGIVEAKNSMGEQFGDERLDKIIINAKNNRFNEVLKTLNDFTGESNQKDDITLVELNCQGIPALENSEETIRNDDALPWNISVSLSEIDMRTPEPVNKLSTILSSMPYISRHKGVLHVLLAEIYANSIEHSILNIESVSKTDEEHFEEYYKIRNEALLGLTKASINFNFSFFVEKHKHYLEIKVSDSGTGFKNKVTTKNNKQLHGRGLDIINSFSEKVSFSEDGKVLTILYKL